MTMEPPEIHAPHGDHQKGTPRWLDLTVAIAALITSIVSIVLGLQNGNAMQQLVQAQSWPNLSFDSSNVVEGKSLIRLSLRSTGSGPVRVRSVVLRYKGQVYRNWPQLMRACCAPPRVSDAELGKLVGNNLLTGSSRGSLLPGDDRLIISMDPSSADPKLWKAFDRERNAVEVDACYCSVFTDCYELKGNGDPKPVKECRPTENQWNS